MAIQAAINGIVYDNPYARKTSYPRMFEGRVLLAPGEFLPKRQQEVWMQLAMSETTKGIALDMKLSQKTVEYHRASLMRRLGLYTIAELTREAIATGLINE